MTKTIRNKSEALAAYEWLTSKYCRQLAWSIIYLHTWCTHKPATFHNQLMKDMCESILNLLCAGPREFAKSRIVLMAMMYDGVHLNRTEQMLIGNNLDLAVHQMSFIRKELDTNPMLQAAHQITPGSKLTDKHFEFNIGLKHKTPFSFHARGWEGSVRGWHMPRIVLDDIEALGDSPMVMEKNYHILHGDVFGATANDPDTFGGQIVFIGNYLNEYCTLLRCQEIDAKEAPHQWISRKFTAYEEGPTQAFTKTEIGHSTWPSFWPDEALHEKRIQMNMGEAWRFEVEFQNRLVGARDAIWQRAMFPEVYTELPPMFHLISAVAIDPAEKTQEAGDETGVISMAKCIEGPMAGYYFVLDGRLARLGPNDIVQEAIRQYIGQGTVEIPQCEMMGVENKTAKGQGPLAELLLQGTRVANLSANITQLVPQTYGDKRQRALRVVDIGRQQRILWPANPTPDLRKIKEQVLMFTGMSAQKGMSAIDDGHDAFVWCLIMLKPKEMRNQQAMVQLPQLRNKLVAPGSRIHRVPTGHDTLGGKQWR